MEAVAAALQVLTPIWKVPNCPIVSGTLRLDSTPTNQFREPLLQEGVFREALGCCTRDGDGRCESR